MEEKRCNELADMIDAMDNTDKKFILWKLVGEYGKEVLKDASTINPMDRMQEIIKYHLGQEAHWCGEIVSDLYHQIW